MRSKKQYFLLEREKEKHTHSKYVPFHLLLSTDNKYILNCGLFLEETWEKKDRGEDF